HEASPALAQHRWPATRRYSGGPLGPEFGKASPIGSPLVLLLMIATVLLVRNMNQRIKNLPDSFDADNPEPDQLADEGTDRAGVDAAGSGSEPGPESQPH